MHNLFLGPLLLFAVLLSELLDPHVAPKCCFSFLVGSNFHSGALQFPLNSSPWMTFEQRRAGASVSVIPSDATEVSPDRSWTKSKSGGVWSFARSSSASSNPVTPSQADPKCGSWRLFLQVLYVLQLSVSHWHPSQATLVLPAPGEVFLLFFLAHCSHCSETLSSSWRSKASCLHVSWARRSQRNGCFPPNEHGAAEDYMGCSAADTTHFK